jgi:hypothetical protein
MPPDQSQSPEPDPIFVARFRSRVDPAIAGSFTPDQLAAIHTAFALRTLPRHSIDVRRSIPTPWGRMYLAIVAGREKRGSARRAADRALRRAGSVADLAVVGSVLSIAALAGAGALYLLKIALAIDLVPGIDMLPDGSLLHALLG